MIDFSEYERTRTLFGGSERKVGLNINDFEYMIKFPKKTAFGKRNNHISEYLGSHIYGLLGYNVQETHLGVYNGEEVDKLIDTTEFIDETQKRFYKYMLRQRLEKILLPTYKKLEK